jgi:hypothetical protein
MQLGMVANGAMIPADVVAESLSTTSVEQEDQQRCTPRRWSADIRYRTRDKGRALVAQSSQSLKLFL